MTVSTQNGTITCGSLVFTLWTVDKVNLCASRDAIGLWLHRYVPISPLPMSNVVRPAWQPMGRLTLAATAGVVDRSHLPRGSCQDVVLFIWTSCLQARDFLPTPSSNTTKAQPPTTPRSQVERYAASEPPPHITDSSVPKLQTSSSCFGRSRNSRSCAILNLTQPTHRAPRTTPDHQAY